MGTKLNFLFAYHPQIDGQSEIASLTIANLLRAFVTQIDQQNQWERYLSMVEYACKIRIHNCMVKIPFKIVEGRPKLPMMVKNLGNAFAADEYSKDLKELIQRVKDAISIIQ